MAALVTAWWLASPYRGLARVTLLLLALALWPIHYSLALGQPIPEILALLAGAWWLMRHDRPILAGLLLALATALKPQDVILVPLALLFVRRPRVFVAWAAGCAVLALAFAVSLGTSGLRDFWNTTAEVEGDPWHHYWTWAFFAGPGLPAQILEGGSAVAALAVAWRKRADLELVIAAALIGSVLSAIHAHETDAAMYVLAAWLLLRSNIALAPRLWLLPGIAALQATAIGLVWPVFLWAVIWLVLIGQAGFSARQSTETPNGRSARATIADSEPKTAPSTALSGPGAGKLKSDSVERA
ncbi:MAG TPA: glycosyltransferase 87 family protein [Candidatus Acidoferrum sp.]|nr:glycosyltransferase 87 family protein [Candidatus Acidoferrum sp.]